MKKTDNVILLLLLVLFITCDKKEETFQKPTKELTVHFEGDINDTWENEDGWFVINRLYKLKDYDQLSITLSKGYKNLSILLAAKEGNLGPGTFPLTSNGSVENSACAEYYVLGSTRIYKCESGALTITEVNPNEVKGYITGNFSLSGRKEVLAIEGSFSIPPLY